MNRTSKVLRRLGVPVLAAVTMLGGEAVLAATAANAAVTTVTITNQGANDTTNDAYGGATPDTPTSQTVTLANGPAAAQAITLTVTGSATIADPGGQAAGNTLAIGAGGHTATCTTSATPGSQACLFAVHDAISQAVTVTAHDQSDPTVADDTNNDHFNSLTYTNCPQNATNTPANCTTQQAANTSKTYTVTYLQDGAGVAGRNINFTLNGGQATLVQGPGTSGHNGNIIGTNQTGCVSDAAGHCDVTVQANQNAAGSGDLDATTATAAGVLPSNVTPYPDAEADEGINYIANATPSRLDLVATRTLEPANQSGAALRPGDAVQKTFRLFGGCTVTTGNTNCTGSPLAGVSVTVTVDHGFVTPNCFTGGAAGAPASGPVNSTYADCTFDPAAATNGPVGNLKNSGTSATVSTDPNGYFTLTFGIAKDAGFDDDGTVVQKVTATAVGGSGPLNETNPGQVAGTCAANGSTAGCTTAGTTWSTDTTPLNGGTVKIVWISNPAPSGDVQIGGLHDGNIFVVHNTDQFGNLTTASGDTDLVVTGAGADNTFECFQDYDNTHPCNFTNGGVDTTPNGVETSTINNVDGSFTNPFDSAGNPQQDRFFVESSGEEGAQTITVTYHATVATFGTFTASPAGNTATYGAQADVDKTDTTTLNYYKPVPTTFTFTTTPSSRVRAGTGVTVSATVLDQKGKGIRDLTANFIRSGPQTQSGTSCTATQANPLTNDNGQAGFSFTCTNPSTQVVTIVITDQSGNEIARSTKTIQFTGKVHISASINCFSPRKHQVTCKVHVSPKFKGLTVVFFNAKGHRIGSDGTNGRGNAFLHLKGLKSHRHHTYSAHVRHSSRTFGTGAGSDGVTVK